MPAEEAGKGAPAEGFVTQPRKGLGLKTLFTQRNVRPPSPHWALPLGAPPPPACGVAGPGGQGRQGWALLKAWRLSGGQPLFQRQPKENTCKRRASRRAGARRRRRALVGHAGHLHPVAQHPALVLRCSMGNSHVGGKKKIPGRLCLPHPCLQEAPCPQLKSRAQLQTGSLATPPLPFAPGAEVPRQGLWPKHLLT